jgi:putative glycerol-1-phosphate prenyltransferase
VFCFVPKILFQPEMPNSTIYNTILTAKREGKKKFVVLIDPDKIKMNNIDRILHLAQMAQIDYFFVGGSLVVSTMLEQSIEAIRAVSNAPVILFPGDISQISPSADAILYLSLISGRNPELLIGKHVVAAPMLKKSRLEILSTGYMLIDGGRMTTATYMSGTLPIPSDKNEIAVCTAMAGEMLGMKLIYMDAGSGAQHPIPESMIKAVSQAIEIPLIVGGGIRTPEKVQSNFSAGADIIVVGNALEKDPSLLIEMAEAAHEVTSKSLLQV